MWEFWTALILFLAFHSLPSVPAFRTTVIEKLGRRLYIVLYSSVSVVLLTWLIIAARQSPYVPVWTPSAWHAWPAVILMPFAFMFLAAGIGQPNPLSVTFRNQGFDPDNPGIVAVTRHPILWAFGLWSATHLLPNGDLVMLILYGGMALFAFGGMAIVERRARRTLGEEEWKRLSANTSIVPFAAILAGRASFPTDRPTLIAAAIGLALYVLFMVWLHRWLFWVEPLAWIQFSPNL